MKWDVSFETKCQGMDLSITDQYHAISSKAQYRQNLKDSLELFFMVPALSVGMLSLPVLGGVAILALPYTMTMAAIEVFKSIFDFVNIAR